MSNLILKLSIAGLLSLVMVSCSDRPDGILDNEQMANMLYEIHIAESVTKIDYQNQNVKSEYIYNKIFESYNIAPAEFDSCIAWYARHQKEYLEVYDLVKLKLEAEKQRIQNGNSSCPTPKLLKLREAPTHFSTSDSCSNPYIQRFRCGTARWIGWDK